MKLKQWVGAGLIILSIAAMFFWETTIREKIAYRSVPVCAEDIAAGQTVTEGMFKLIKMTPGSVINGALKEEDVPAVYGFAASEDLKENQQLLWDYFSQEPPAAEGVASFVIDREWICSESILDEAGDTVDLYLVSTGAYLGSYRIKVLPSSDRQLEIAAKFQDYLLIRAAAFAEGPGSIIVINKVCK